MEIFKGLLKNVIVYTANKKVGLRWSMLTLKYLFFFVLFDKHMHYIIAIIRILCFIYATSYYLIQYTLTQI